MFRRGCDARPVDAGEDDCCEGVTGHGWVGEQGVDGDVPVASEEVAVTGKWRDEALAS